MAEFKSRMDEIDTLTHAARRETMDYMAFSGPLDQDRFHRLITATQKLEEEKRGLFEAHVLGIRTLLGDEKGAEFFSRLRAHILSKKNSFQNR